MAKAIGIDFGTTNSVVAVLQQDGSVATRRHAFDGALDGADHFGVRHLYIGDVAGDVAARHREH